MTFKVLATVKVIGKKKIQVLVLCCFAVLVKIKAEFWLIINLAVIEGVFTCLLTKRLMHYSFPVFRSLIRFP